MGGFTILLLQIWTVLLFNVSRFSDNCWRPLQFFANEEICLQCKSKRRIVPHCHIELFYVSWVHDMLLIMCLQKINIHAFFNALLHVFLFPAKDRVIIGSNSKSKTVLPDPQLLFHNFS